MPFADGGGGGEWVDDGALDLIVERTHCNPYFLQEWGKYAWKSAKASPITAADVESGTRETMAALDASFFRVRLDRLSPAERIYLRAIAEIGPGPHRSGEIAKCLRRPVQSLGPTREGLINKGMIWSPAHGDTAFTVPRSDGFMKRMIPGEDWRN